MFQGDALQDSLTMLREKGFALDCRINAVYVPSNLLMFLYIPLKYQILWTVSVSLLWNILCSIFTSGNNHAFATQVMALNGFGSSASDPPIVQFVSWTSDFGGGDI